MDDDTERRGAGTNGTKAQRDSKQKRAVSTREQWGQIRTEGEGWMRIAVSLSSPCSNRSHLLRCVRLQPFA